MSRLKTKGLFFKFYEWLPIIILFISVLNEFDLNYLNLDYFSFNFPFILIFYFTLKDSLHFDYLLVFIAGLINDVVIGLPLGISPFSYVLICFFSSYLRSITIRPNIIKDWFYFLFVISLINSLNYTVLFLIFSYELNLTFYLVNNFFTFLLYIFFTQIFNYYLKGLNE